MPRPQSPDTHARSAILLIDDNRELCLALQEYCALEGMDMHLAHNGEEGLPLALNGRFDLVVLDVRMPGMSGMDILRKIRARTMLPVLMLTAMGADTDRIQGLELGADDYVPKPCSPRELVARIRAILRRSGGSQDASPGVLAFGELTMWPEKHMAAFNNQPLHLTGVEFSVLRILLQHAGEPVSRETLYQEALGRSATPFDRSLDVHLSNIRRKMGQFDQGWSPIKALRGQGYQLVAR